MCVLVSQFSSQNWDDEYGFIACSQIPTNIIATFMYPIVILNEFSHANNYGHVKLRSKKEINDFICLVLFAPYSVIFTIMFSL